MAATPMGCIDMGDVRWIVLIDKTPRGPLSEEDVRTLIEQKIIRANDLASKIEPAEDGINIKGAAMAPDSISGLKKCWTRQVFRELPRYHQETRGAAGTSRGA